MRPLLLALLCALPALATCTITGPAAASTQGIKGPSGTPVVQLIGSCTDASISYAEWVLNDVTVIARIAASGTNALTQRLTPPIAGQGNLSVNWNSADDAFDGPQYLTLNAYDAKGALLSSSAETNFRVNNYGLVVGSVVPTLPNPTVSGTMNISFTLTGGTQADCSSNAAEGGSHAISVDGRTLFNGNQSTAITHRVDTTLLLNGPHFAVAIRSFSDPAFGTNICRTAGIAFRFNVNNAANTVVGILPGARNVTLEPNANGGAHSYSLHPCLQLADKSTDCTQSGWTFSPVQVCTILDQNLYSIANGLKWPCTTGFSQISPANNAQGYTHVQVDKAGLISVPSQVPPDGAVGVADILVSKSGKIAHVWAQVKNSQKTTHFTKNGSVTNTYKPGQSIFMTSIENFTAEAATLFEPQVTPYYIKSGATAFEGDVTLDPTTHCGGATGACTSWTQWVNLWRTDYGCCGGILGNITNAQSRLGGPSFFGRSDAWYSIPTMQSINQANPGSMHTIFNTNDVTHAQDPIFYSYQQLKATGFLLGVGGVDETGATDFATFCPGCGPLSMAGGNITKIVVNNGSATFYLANKAQWPGATRYQRYSGVVIQNAQNSGFNGTKAVTELNCSIINQSLPPRDAGCPGLNGRPNPAIQTNAPIYGTFTVSGVTAPNGTYTVNGVGGTLVESSLVIQTLGLTPVISGQSPFMDNNFALVAQKAAAAGINLSQPIVAGADYDAYFWRMADMGNFTQVFKSEGDCLGMGQTFPQAKGFFGSGGCAYAHRWGESTQDGHLYYSARDHLRGWTIHALGPDVPEIFLINGTGADGNAGGNNASTASGPLQRMISSISASGILTTTTAHNLYGPGDGISWCPGCQPTAFITGNSNAANNKLVYLGLPTGANTVEAWSYTGGCSTSVSPLLPVDLGPGEHFTVNSSTSGTLRGQNYALSSNSCANGTYPVAIGPGKGCLSRACMALGKYLGAGTGGTIQMHTGEFGEGGQSLYAPYDQVATVNRLGRAQLETMAALADGWAGARTYTWASLYPDLVAQPGDGFDMQNGLSPYPYVDIYRQRRFWGTSAGFRLAKRLTPDAFQSRIASPDLIAYAGDPVPWLTTGAYCNEAVYGTCGAGDSKLVIISNTSDYQQSFNLDHTQYQSGTNPISVYRLGYPDFYTQLLTGLQSTQAITLQAGETMALIYHNSGASNVTQTAVKLTPPASGSPTQAVVRQIYVFPDPLQEAGSASATTCAIPGTCLVPLDNSFGNAYVQITYLNASNVVLRSETAIPFNGQSVTPAALGPWTNTQMIVQTLAGAGFWER